MPKKFKGENSKAVEARARKATQKDEEELRKQEQLEDEYWKDDDKHLQKKLQRKVLHAMMASSPVLLYLTNITYDV